MAGRNFVGTMACALLADAAAPLAQRIVTGDAIVPVTPNGTPARLRIDPGAPGVPVIAEALAKRVGLKGGGMLGSHSIACRSAPIRSIVVRRWCSTKRPNRSG